ncbi:MAG TPA: hypothetical protein VMK12_27075 [Anaeromyxobacteraceae bacterium]|nr:hypothetical protein [Anaeromyxobacteraceae bacterium]
MSTRFIPLAALCLLACVGACSTSPDKEKPVPGAPSVKVNSAGGAPATVAASVSEVGKLHGVVAL